MINQTQAQNIIAFYGQFDWNEMPDDQCEINGELFRNYLIELTNDEELADIILDAMSSEPSPDQLIYIISNFY